METIYLFGSEDVRAASGNIIHAASEMNRAAASINDTLETQRRYMEEWLGRFESAVADMGGAAGQNAK